MNSGKKFLSDLKLYSDYFKWQDDKGRYETWEEACDSILTGHRTMYSTIDVENYLEKARTQMHDKRVLASQRTLQYRYPQLKNNNERLYNCVGALLNKNDYFNKFFYILLSGCGLDFSLRKQFVSQLSKLKERTLGTKTFIIPDSIEGWADSLGVLMSSYFADNQPFPEYAGYKIKFDYSLIRPKGAYISGGFRAPGPEGLQQSLEKIEKLVDNWLINEGDIIRGILAYDIVMHSADAVLSGGVRRSATSILIDEDDVELINAKLGNWRQENPQRARSNNAVGLYRNKFSYEELDDIIKLNQGDNDLSFIFVHDEYEVSNPCFTGDMKVLTSDGYQTFSSLENKEDISFIDAAGNINEGKVTCTGAKKVIELKFRNRPSIFCTPQHLFMTTEQEEVEAQDLLGETLVGFNEDSPTVIEIVELGGLHKVYDFSLTNMFHWGVVEGVIAHNCREITFRPLLEDGRTAIQACVVGSTKLITKGGLTLIEDAINQEIEIWNGKNWAKVTPVKTGLQNTIYRVHFNDGSFLDTNGSHKFLVKNRFQKEYLEKTTLDLVDLLGTTNYGLQLPRALINYTTGFKEPKAYDYGFILGDGTCKPYKDGKDRKPFASVFAANFHLKYPFVTGHKSDILYRDYKGKPTGYYNVSFDVDYKFAQRLKYEEGLPKEIFSWDKESIINFLAGWIDTDGTVTYNNKIRVYGEESKIRDLQLLLTKIGTDSSVNLMSKKGTITNFATRNRDIWYLQISNCENLWCTKTILHKTEVKAKGKFQLIKSIEKLDILQDVYCFEEFDLHQGVFNNVLTKQCNLSEINASACTTDEEFYLACEAASILGTLQAGYTSFPYLGKDTEDLIKREALIGVSITGWMNNPKLFNEKLLKKGASIVKETNKELANLLGINPAARTTTVKPSGNSSVILGTASGIHPEHSERYFRIMQLNKESDTAKWLEINMPFLLEESYWSNTKSDYVVYIPVENPSEGFYKKDMKGIKHLEAIQFVQENWVNSGTNVDLCFKPWLRNSVSCTVIIDDLKKISKYIYQNQNNFKAVSFISDYGDKDFNQAPFTSVPTMETIIDDYGKGSLFISGLIVDGLHYFNNDLWIACDLVKDPNIVLTGTREQVLLKKYWLTRAKKFADNFFKGDIQKLIYCLKDVHLLHKWELINREIFPVDFSKILDKPTYKNISDYASIACSGGQCELPQN